MTSSISREEALARTKAFLENEYPKATHSDLLAGHLARAFPQGVIPEFDDEGHLKRISLSPEDPDYIVSLISQAKGSVDAFDAVLVWAAAQLMHKRTIQSHEARAFIIDYLSGTKKRPSKRGRRSTATAHQLRHATLCLAISHLEEWGFKVSRNDEAEHRESGCDIVAEAMAELRFRPQSFKEISRIAAGSDRVRFI